MKTFTTTISALALSLLLGWPAPSDAAGHKAPKRKRQPVISGFLVPASKLRTDALPKPSGHLKLYAVNFAAGLEVDLYGDDGEFDPEALEQLNHFWRCRRTGTEKPIEPHLFELLSIIQDHFDGRTIELVSGFRNQPHTSSYHFHGSASDIQIPGVPQRELHAFVQTLDTGGMGLGLYPRGGFIHVDVRPQSYRWTDWSPPGSSERAHRRVKRHDRNT
jgi:uncharacterized protein YcbK (DUF882 family)